MTNVVVVVIAIAIAIVILIVIILVNSLVYGGTEPCVCLARQRQLKRNDSYVNQNDVK